MPDCWSCSCISSCTCLALDDAPAPPLRSRLDSAAWNCADSCAVESTADDEPEPEPEPVPDGLVELCTLVIELPKEEADAATPPSRASGAAPAPVFFIGPSVGEY